MGMKLISQSGRSASAGRWELGSSQDMGWGRTGVFGMLVAAGVCAPLWGVCWSSGGSWSHHKRIEGDRFALLGTLILTRAGFQESWTSDSVLPCRKESAGTDSHLKRLAMEDWIPLDRR